MIDRDCIVCRMPFPSAGAYNVVCDLCVDDHSDVDWSEPATSAADYLAMMKEKICRSVGIEVSDFEATRFERVTVTAVSHMEPGTLVVIQEGTDGAQYEAPSRARNRNGEDWRSFKVGDLVTRDGSDVQRILKINEPCDLIEFECIKAPSMEWCEVGFVEGNVAWRYSYAGEIVDGSSSSPALQIGR